MAMTERAGARGTSMGAGRSARGPRTTAAGKPAKKAAPRWKSSPARTPEEYLATLPPDRKPAVERLREVLRTNLPGGFEETIDCGMLSYVVPHSLYPAGYHVDPNRPVPFIALASQKRYVSLYHMGLYEGALLAWFRTAWPKHTGAKLALGKCCLRLRNLDEIPYGLIGELAGRMTPRQWIAAYEAARGNR